MDREDNNTEWIDPRQQIWGFHCHQELPLEQFPDALAIQQDCSRYLNLHNMGVGEGDVFKPGYGPHIHHMWELRIENTKANALTNLGLAISYLAVNRFGHSAYIHPLMHDPNQPEDLETEGRLNQPNSLWFSHKVEQNQDFFFHPPRHADGQIVDTRTPRVMAQNEIEKLKSQAKVLAFRDPFDVITHGFHIHVDFEDHERELALAVFEKFADYLSDNHLLPSSTRIYKPGENGPHVRAGWEVKFKGRAHDKDKRILKDIGLAVGWLMCNRHELSVFMHPETWQEGDLLEELKAHEQYSFFLGEPPLLDLSFFTNQIEKQKLSPASR